MKTADSIVHLTNFIDIRDVTVKCDVDVM